jgi:hypothetical protein
MRRVLFTAGALLLLAALGWLGSQFLAPQAPRLHGDASGDSAAAMPERAAGRSPSTGVAHAQREAVANATPAAVADASGTLVVRLTDQDGEPIAGQELDLRPDGAGSPGDAIAIRTDAGGVARRSLEPGGYELILHEQPEPRRFAIAAGREETVELRMALGPPLTGVVVDPDGAPVPFAQVLGRWNWSRLRMLRLVDADAAGRFSIRLRQGSIAAISATARGFRPSREVLRPAGKDPLVLQLGAAPAALVVIVTRADGTPAAGTWIRVDSGTDEVPEQAGIPGTPFARREATCDAAGRVAFADLWPGPAKLYLRAPEHLAHGEPLELAGGIETVHRVQLRLGATLEGTVRDAAGAPIGAATVGTRWLVSTKSARDGSYRLSGLDPEQPSIGVTHPQFEETSTTLELRAGATARWDPVLQPRPEILGRLLDGEDRPVAGCRLAAFDATATDFQSAGAALTDPDGRFRMHLATRSPVDLHAMFLRGCPLPRVPEGGRGVIPGGPEVTLRLTDDVRGTSWIHGRVAAPPKAAGAKVAVQLHQLGVHPTGWRTSVDWTDAPTRSFQLGPLPAGEYRILLAATGPRIAEQEAIRFSLGTGERRDLGELRFQPTAELALRIEPLHGVAPDSISVSARANDGSGRLEQWQLETAGRSQLALLPGTYELTIFGEGFVWQRRSIELQSGRPLELTIRLEPAVRRKLYFELPPGESECRYEILDPRGELLHDWEYDRDDLDRELQPFFGIGRHHVRATGGSGRVYTDSFTVESLQPDPAGIRIRPR